MDANISLVLFGEVPLLLQTRQWMLQSSGYDVRKAKSIGEASEEISGRRVSLLIVCHSVSVQDGQDAVALLRSRWPEAKYLMLREEDSVEVDTESAVNVSGVNGPQRLIETVRKIAG